MAFVRGRLILMNKMEPASARSIANPLGQRRSNLNNFEKFAYFVIRDVFGFLLLRCSIFMVILEFICKRCNKSITK
ncbi:hypothetical protein ABFX02_01G077100 [Erythranthe guttata]